MTDYGHTIEFGVFASPDADRVRETLALAQLADVAGLELFTVQDHPYQGRFVDTWTLLSAIGARTSAIRLTPNVASLPLRPPVLLAKAAATLDLVTGGRAELALGTGAFWDAIVAAGGPRRTPKQAVDALVEAIQVIRGMWRGESLTFEGEHYRVKGLHAGPVPAHDIPVWLGAYKPRMLRVTGEYADVWVPSMGYADPPDLPEMNAIIDEASRKAGRGPEAIRRAYNVNGRFGRAPGFLQGTPGDWAEQLTELAVEQGMSTFILGTDDPDALRTFSQEVAPRVRELVEEARSRPDEAPVEEHQVVASAPVEPPVLRVRPTPDDGTRLTGELTWDESSRPSVRRPVTEPPPAEAAAQHLVDIHDALRAELEQVRSIVDQVRAGHLSVGHARSVINTMALRQNNWTLGAFCESYCRLVTGHHTLEDRSVFPHLRRVDSELTPVLDRLIEEHEVIAAVLDGVDQALVELVESDGYGEEGGRALDHLQHQVDLMTDTLLSHLAYEERELIPSLAVHGFG
jgi:alkanesulfonate monooxygenase SsuD/methylene tetrahydromethanopterin reductase-like flavin-dependent oxidoreductase (luciferase family)